MQKYRVCVIDHTLLLLDTPVRKPTAQHKINCLVILILLAQVLFNRCFDVEIAVINNFSFSALRG